MDTLRTDVLVIGSGPAGSGAAIEASRRDVSVLIVDRAPILGGTTRKVGFVPVGFAPNIPLPRFLRQQSVDGARIHIESDIVERSQPGFTIPLQDLCRILAGIAVDFGTEVRAGWSLDELDPAGHAVVTSESTRLAIEARVIIACDGPDSTAAHLLELPAQPHLNVIQLEVPLLRETSWLEFWLARRLRGGYAWFYPKRITAGIGVAVQPEFEQKVSLDRLVEGHRDRLVEEGLVGARELTRTAGSIPCGGIRPELCFDRVILAGDAAGTAHPMTVAGITTALDSGRFAGAAAVAHLRGDMEALETYQRAMNSWLGGIHARAVARRHFMQDAWDRIEFSRLMRDTCLGR